ncbi:hypothetical protein pb186bvf_001775 [Paramecium bursaria]
MVDLVHEKYSKIYFASKLSGAFCFCWIVYLIIFLVPLLIGFTSFQFWNIQKEIFTQPIVNSRGQYLLKIFTSSSVTYTYTNIYEIFNVIDTPLGLVSFSESSNSTYDRINQNNRPSTMNFSIVISGSSFNANLIRRVELMIFLDYTIDYVALDKLQTYAYINVYTPVGAQVINTYGSLEFRQVYPLLDSSSYRTRYNYPPYYSQQGALLIDTLDINNENFNRNESVYYNYENYVQQPTTTTTQQLKINCYATIAKYQKVNYTAGILEAAKFSWMQYFSIFLIFWKLGTTLLVFVVENKYSTNREITQVKARLNIYIDFILFFIHGQISMRLLSYSLIFLCWPKQIDRLIFMKYKF